MRLGAALALALGVVALPGGEARAQDAAEAALLVARADSALARGDTAAAESGYARALEADPGSSRAAYQLATLHPPGAPAALRLFRRYAALEPQDAWGWIALGQALTDAGLPEEARAPYREAVRLAPEARGGPLGLARALALADRTDASIDVYERWLSSHPEDAEAWTEVARQRQRAGRAREALEGLQRALSLVPDAAPEGRLAALQAAAAPALAPRAGGSRDSDGNQVLRLGAQADALAGGRLRLGLAGGQVRVSDDVASATALDGRITLDWRPRRVLHLTGEAGATRVGRETVPAGRLRLRWTSPAAGPAAELRAQRAVIAASPLLLANAVVLSEARASLDAPLLGPLRVRGLGRLGRLSDPTATNRRTGLGGGLLARVAPAMEIGAVYEEVRHAQASSAGYFAPERAQTLEAATYLEWYGVPSLVLALDAGAGAQRIQEHGAAAGEWRRALRLWSLVAWTVRPGAELGLEVELYDALVGHALAPTPEGAAAWRYGSASLALRWALP